MQFSIEMNEIQTVKGRFEVVKIEMKSGKARKCMYVYGLNWFKQLIMSFIELNVKQ